MLITSKASKLFYLTISILVFSCSSSKHNKAGVESAMKYYNHLIENSDAVSISKLYSPDGNLGGIAIGRDSIRRFLSSFKNIQVLSQSSTTKSIDMKGDTAIQKGTYAQTDVVSQKDTVKVKGEYIAKWEWIPKEGWRIKQMTTKSTN